MNRNFTSSMLQKETKSLKELTMIPQKYSSTHSSSNLFIYQFKEQLHQATNTIIEQLYTIRDEVDWYADTYFNDDFESKIDEKIEVTLKRLETHYDKAYETHSRLKRLIILSKDIQKHFKNIWIMHKLCIIRLKDAFIHFLMHKDTLPCPFHRRRRRARPPPRSGAAHEPEGA